MQTLLGKETRYPTAYSPELLTPMDRQLGREGFGLGDVMPFIGYDHWNIYELSWLNEKGVPRVAVVRMRVASNSSYIVESKSLKLYFFSFNQEQFAHVSDVKRIIETDLRNAFGGEVRIELEIAGEVPPAKQTKHELLGECIDGLNFRIQSYAYDPDLLKVEHTNIVEETLHSHLFRSNCPVTGQPDWANVCLSYRGKKLCRESLLGYIVSFRNAQEFHEHCIEQMFLDLLKVTQAEELTVTGYFMRRGGIDINPVRSLRSMGDDATAKMNAIEAGGFATFRQ